jgi:8-oxo-dGTP pyrophosphatase MutT (NUDIX family)
MRIQVYAKVLVIRPDGQVLVLKRSKTDERRPGEWDFPGGGVEAGEGPDEGAARELFEEAGITVKSKHLIMLYAETAFYEPRKDSNTRSLFIARISTEQAQSVVLSHEHDEYKWQILDAAAAEHPHPVYRAGLQYALDHGLLKA